MNVYKIDHRNWDFYTWQSAVVFAENEEAAKRLHPSGEGIWKDGKWRYFDPNKIKDGDTEPRDPDDLIDAWCKPENVKVQFVCTTEDDVSMGIIDSTFLTDN